MSKLFIIVHFPCIFSCWQITLITPIIINKFHLSDEYHDYEENTDNKVVIYSELLKLKNRPGIMTKFGNRKPITWLLLFHFHSRSNNNCIPAERPTAAIKVPAVQQSWLLAVGYLTRAYGPTQMPALPFSLSD